MFKEIVQNLTQKTFGKATQGAVTAGNNMLNGALEGLAQRSPLLGSALMRKVADVRNTKAVQANFIKQNEGSAFGEDVKEEVGPDASAREIQKKMASILDQLTKDVKKQSADQLKENELYKKYSKYFDEYKNKVDKALQESRRAVAEPAPVAPEGTEVDDSTVVEKLQNIEANTKELVDKFDSIQPKDNVAPDDGLAPIMRPEFVGPPAPAWTHESESKDGGLTTKEIPPVAPAKQDFPQLAPEMLDGEEPRITPKPIPEVVEEPKVEPVKANTPSNFDDTLRTFEKPEQNPDPKTPKVVPAEEPSRGILGKIYDKSYNAVSRLFGGPGLQEPPEKPEVGVQNPNVPEERLLAPVEAQKPVTSDGRLLASEDTKDTAKIDEEILIEAKKTNDFLQKAEDERKAADAKADEAATETPQVVPAKTDKPIDELQKKNDKVEKASEDKQSLASKLMDTVGSKVKTPGMSMLGNAAKVAGGAAAVAGAGYAGYKAGEWLNENTDIQAGIASSIDTAKGWFGNSDEDKQKEADTKSAQDLYEKKVKDGTLTTKSAKFFEDKGIQVDKSKIITTPEAVKSPVIAETAKSVEAKDTIAAEKSKASTAPVILNTTNNNVSGGGSSAPTIISGMNIRNSESTFDRVQMQNYWSRTA